MLLFWVSRRLRCHLPPSGAPNAAVRRDWFSLDFLLISHTEPHASQVPS